MNGVFFFRNHPGIVHVNTRLLIRLHTNTTQMCVLTQPPPHTPPHSHTHTYLLKYLPRIRWIFVRLLPKINVARCVCVCVHSCTCVSVLSFVSSLLNLSNPHHPPPPSAVSLSFSSPSLSPMNRLNFLMSCFYGLLMLIHNSPYALSLHPPVSCCLPRLIHPPPAPSSPNHTLISLIFLLQQCLLYIYRHRNTCMHTLPLPHSHLYVALMCAYVISLQIYTCLIYLPVARFGKLEKKHFIMKNIPVQTLKMTR